MAKEIKKVLIFRHGSLGDTVVALPCFHLIARTFPNAERRVLTTVSGNDNVVPLSAVLDHTGLVHGYLTYPVGPKNVGQLLRLREEIKRWEPDALIYLAEPRGPLSVWRDTFFFKLCGIKKLIGAPYTKMLRENRWLPERKSFEHESQRLARCLQSLGDVSVDDRSSWDLGLTKEEEENTLRTLEGWKGRERFIACNVSAKVKAKDWGRENWQKLFGLLSGSCPHLGLIMIGAEAGAEYSEEVAGA